MHIYIDINIYFYYFLTCTVPLKVKCERQSEDKKKGKQTAAAAAYRAPHMKRLQFCRSYKYLAANARSYFSFRSSRALVYLLAISCSSARSGGSFPSLSVCFLCFFFQSTAAVATP